MGLGFEELLIDALVKHLTLSMAMVPMVAAISLLLLGIYGFEVTIWFVFVCYN